MAINKQRLTVASKICRLTIGLVCCGYLQIGCVQVPVILDQTSPFEQIPVEYEHVWEEGSHPFTGAAVIDIDNDGTMEIFVGGGQGQGDSLLQYRDGKLVNIVEGKGFSNGAAAYGSTSIDLDNDGDTDLIVARNDGVYLYLNQGGRFQESKIPLNLPKQAVPFSVAVSDIDHDGYGDLYISLFADFPSFRSGVFNDADHAKVNRLLKNNGDLTFTDITESSGTSGKQNTFLSVFVDLDADGWQDLVLAQNTGEVEVFSNNKDRTFKAVPTDSGFGFWMGLAVGDIDNDGDQDLFFSNAGDSIPAFLTKGDLREDQRQNLEWLLLRNDGDFKFVDVTEAYRLTGEGFAWGTVFEDLNLDGHLDLLVAQNYIKWPVHKLFKLSGRTYLQERSNTRSVFHHVKKLGLENHFYGQSPLIVDLNGDAKPDVVWINMDGPVRAFLNTSSGNYLAISPPDIVALLGTRITVQTAGAKSYTREITTSTGMLTDQTPELFFGLGKTRQVERIIIERPNGKTEIIESPSINKKIRIH